MHDSNKWNIFFVIHDLFADCEELTVGETDDQYFYRYHPSTVNVEMIEFEVKASSDVHISLSSSSSDVPDMYEIVISGWGNMQSVIRRCIQCDNEVTVSTPGYLSPDEFRGFWIKYDQTTGVLQVGREGNAYFMQWQDPNPLDVEYVGYTTGFGSTGVFRFCNLSKLIIFKNNNEYFFQNTVAYFVSNLC